MNANDVLRRLRYALDLDDPGAVRMFGLGGREVGADSLASWLARDGDPLYTECPPSALAAFLDGLVLARRGPRDAAAPARGPDPALDNNLVLKKLRIALELQEQDMLAVLRLGGMELSPSELGALFRKPDHKHYRPAGDQLLRAFLKGLTTKLRGP